MVIDNFMTQKASCVRIFTFQLLTGKAKEYHQYLTNVVEVIDRDAHQKSAFLDVLTLRHDSIDKPGLFQRVFLFSSEAQRSDFSAKMAMSALAFDGSIAAQNQRKEYVKTLRVQLEINDYTFY